RFSEHFSADCLSADCPAPSSGCYRFQTGCCRSERTVQTAAAAGVQIVLQVSPCLASPFSNSAMWPERTEPANHCCRGIGRQVRGLDTELPAGDSRRETRSNCLSNIDSLAHS